MYNLFRRYMHATSYPAHHHVCAAPLTRLAMCRSFSSSFAEACAEAIASTVSKMSFKNCGCDIEGEVMATAIAHEVATIFARVEQDVAAVACTESSDGVEYVSHIGRHCLSQSTASLFASVRILHPRLCVL